MSIKKNLLALAVSSALLSTVSAADVPEGTELAEKQVIHLNNSAELQSLDLHKIEGSPEFNVVRQLFEGLVNTDQDGNAVPGVATEWSSDEEKKVWTFKLRKEAKWSNGDALTANDFVYSWRRLADPKTASPYASYLDYAKLLNQAEIIKGEKKPEELGIKAVDDHTLEITLSESVPYFPGMVAHGTLYPVPQKAIEAHGDAWTKPENIVGNGAYTLKEHINNEKLIIVRNEKYWDNDKTAINEAVFYPIESDKVAFNRFKAGELEYAPGAVPLELFDKIKKEMPEELVIGPQLCTYYYEINQKNITNAKLRTALKLSIDRDVIVEKITKAGQTPAYIFTPTKIAGSKFTDPAWGGLSQKEKNEKAKQLIKESGYDVTKPIELLYNTSEGHKKIAIAVGSMWKQNLGIKTTLKNQEWKTFLDTRRKGEQQVARAGWCGDYNEPSTFLNILKSDSSNNQSFWKSPEFDQLMLDSLKATTDEARAEIYQKAEELIDKDTPVIPIYHYVSVSLVKPQLKGYSKNDGLSNWRVKNMYLTK